MSFAIDFEANNAEFVKSGFPGKIDTPKPSKHVLVLSCMDARVDVSKALGIKFGEAHIVRNGGGRAHDAIRSIVASQQMLETRELHVIHHTDCGFTHFKNPEIKKIIKENLKTGADDMDFLPFTDVEQSVREDVAFLKASPLILNETLIQGWVYRIEDGKITKVN